jgi:four helix bundle protein
MKGKNVMSRFSFEDLEVWQDAVAYADAVLEVMDSLKSEHKHFRLREQMEAAVTSISMNIAEGKGRYSKKEFVQYLYIARGSLFETVTLLKIMKQRDWISLEDHARLYEMGATIGRKISRLIALIKPHQGSIMALP